SGIPCAGFLPAVRAAGYRGRASRSHDRQEEPGSGAKILNSTVEILGCWTLFLQLCHHFLLPIQELYPLLSTPRTVVITMHQKPDADAMGSALGLYHFLRQLGHQVTVVSPTNWARWLNWMPGCDTVVDYELHRDKAEGIMDQAEWFFCLDFNV